MKCDKCNIDYPDELVSLIFINNEYIRTCGICALDILNATHHMHREKFTGIAEIMRKQAIRFRQRKGIK
jgi:hypothetical protein